MLSFSPRALQVRLALFVLAIMLMVSALMLGTYLNERRRVFSQVREDFIRVATLIANDQEELIGRTRQFLLTLALTPAVRNMDSESCPALLIHLIDQYPRTMDLGVVDIRGRLVCSGSPPVDSADFSDEIWFNHSILSSDFAMAPLRRGSRRVTDYAISYPLLDDGGNAHGVVYAMVDLTQSNHFISHLYPTRQIEFTMISDDGMILNCYPEVENCAGKARVKEALVEAVRNMGKGALSLPDSQGIDRLYAFVPLSTTVDTRVYVIIGAPAASLYSSSNKMLALQFAGLWGVTLLALGSVWLGSKLLIIKPVKTMVDTAQRLSKGQMGARTGLAHRKGELGSLAQALDSMAETLENRATQVHEYERQLRSLASQLSGAEDRERRRLAADLHDRLGQLLAVSKIKLGMLLQMDMMPERTALIREIRNHIGQAVVESRSLTFEISPPILYELGLEAALEYLTEQMQNRGGPALTYSDDGQRKPLDDDIRALLYRSAGELLQNAVKHSMAGRAAMKTFRDGDRFVLSVEDDGAGMETDADSSTGSMGGGFGLFSIRERLRHIGGSMIIQSQRGQGTHILLIAPLRSEDAEAS